MPDQPLLARLTSQLAAQGNSNPGVMAAALLRARGQLDADGKLTPAGRARDALGAEGRAKDRAATRSGRPAGDFVYDKATNATHLKSKKPWGR